MTRSGRHWPLLRAHRLFGTLCFFMRRVDTLVVVANPSLGPPRVNPLVSSPAFSRLGKEGGLVRRQALFLSCLLACAGAWHFRLPSLRDRPINREPYSTRYVSAVPRVRCCQLSRVRPWCTMDVGVHRLIGCLRWTRPRRPTLLELFAQRDSTPIPVWVVHLAGRVVMVSAP